MPTVKELFDNMPSTFQKEAAAGMNVVYQFDITGEGGARYHAAIVDGELSVIEGQHEAPSITITMTSRDYIDLSTGKLNGQMAFMTGKIRIKGDLSLAMKMPKIFKQ